MLKMMLVTTRDRARLAEISSVLIRYGLQDIARILGLTSLLNGITGHRSHDYPQSAPERLRSALEELGPTFVKLGQILATRTDLLEPAWTEALEKLHSQAATLPWEILHQQVCDDLGDEPSHVFAEFNTTPLAAASMAQIYRARLHTGEDVVVKVLRPDLARTIHADLRLLTYLTETIEEQSPALARYRPKQMVMNLATALNHELDLTHEANNCEQVALHFAGQQDVVIPRIFWVFTSPRLMVQEYLPGTSPENPRQLAQAGYNGVILAQKGAQAFMKMVLEYRLYHADPHPGNVMALEGNRVGFIDFGMVGQLSERRRNQLLLVLNAIAEGETAGIVNALIEWADGAELDLMEMELAAQSFLDKQGTATLQLGKALADLLAVAREYRLTLPPDLVLLFKALITADGVLHKLDPGFDIVTTLKPLLKQVILQRYKPKSARKRLLSIGAQVLDSGEELPQTLRLIIRRLREGKLHADLNINNLDLLGKALERAAVTLAIAVVTAAFALGMTPWLMATGFRIFGIPVFPVFGFLACGVGIFLLALRLRR